MQLRPLILLFIAVLSSIPYTLTGQQRDRCQTMVVDSVKRVSGKKAESRATFEKWLQKKLREKNKTTRTLAADEVYKLPVVVHVIHQGESIGTGTNVSKEQILSQIKVLNQDFRRKKGTYGYNDHPDGADTKIEFLLAKTDPSGNLTNGIVRKEGSKDTWSITSDDDELKSQSHWDASEYLNLYVCDLNDNNIGYAQFPNSDLQESTTNKSGATDGVVIDYKAFGTTGSAEPPYDNGRTTTHEIGHFLSLLHPWGVEQKCTPGDYCQDTPECNGPEYQCPTDPPEDCDNTPQMIRNYMDYTNDLCMNIFTKDQKARMRTVLENSPRRASLVNNGKYLPPDLPAIDAGLLQFNYPSGFSCDTTVSPVVKVKNTGKDTINNISFILELNHQTYNTFTWSGELASLATTSINLPEAYASRGEHYIEATISSVNGTSDADSTNNYQFQEFYISGADTLPYRYNHEADSILLPWTTVNEDGWIGWESYSKETRRSYGDSTAFYVNNFKYDGGDGQKDYLFSGPVDLSSVNSAYMTFDVAYVPYDYYNADTLAVHLSKDCGETQARTLYKKAGYELRTDSDAETEWHPSSSTHWRREFIDLSNGTGSENTRFIFENITHYGNNLHLDNIQVLPRGDHDIGILEILYPRDQFYIENLDSIRPKAVIMNFGKDTVHTATIKYRIEANTNFKTYNWNDALPPLKGDTITLSKTNASYGTHTFEGFTKSPDGSPDDNKVNDTARHKYHISAQPVAGLREANKAPEHEVMIFPNPSEGVFNLRFAGGRTSNVNYSLYNTTGRQLETGQASIKDNELQLNFADHPEGIYLLKMHTGSFQVSRKLIIR